MVFKSFRLGKQVQVFIIAFEVAYALVFNLLFKLGQELFLFVNVALQSVVLTSNLSNLCLDSSPTIY